MSISLVSKSDGTGAIIEVNEVGELEVTPERLTIGGVFFENSKTVVANATILSNTAVMSAGPITIADGVTVTVQTNGDWSIV
jgi:hypothetical protein